MSTQGQRPLHTPERNPEAQNAMGEVGEILAREYLLTKGYTLREMNWRCGHLEIDIIAQKGDILVFVEVKSRKGDVVDPLEAVTPQKIRRTVKAANAYMKLQKEDFEARFDIITVTGTRENNTLEHIEEAFYPPLSAR